MQPNQPSPIISLIPLILIFFVFYFLLIKPQKKQQRERGKMITGLKKNDEIVTTGGIHGTVVNVKDNTLILKVDENVKIEIDRSAVAYLKKSH